jgi:hypothetical protein
MLNIEMHLPGHETKMFSPTEPAATIILPPNSLSALGQKVSRSQLAQKVRSPLSAEKIM